jgi:hypothetical protein
MFRRCYSEIFITIADYSNLWTEILMTIGSTYANTLNGINYLFAFTKTLPDIGYNTTLLLIIRPNLFQVALITIKFLFYSFLLMLITALRI